MSTPKFHKPRPVWAVVCASGDWHGWCREYNAKIARHEAGRLNAMDLPCGSHRAVRYVPKEKEGDATGASRTAREAAR